MYCQHVGSGCPTNLRLKQTKVIFYLSMTFEFVCRLGIHRRSHLVLGSGPGSGPQLRNDALDCERQGAQVLRARA